MLKRTNGFRAFMRVLGRAYLALHGNDIKQPSTEQIRELWQYSSLKDADFTVERFHPGTSGEKSLVQELEMSISTFRTHRGETAQK
jgi:hypothetical protein